MNAVVKRLRDAGVEVHLRHQWGSRQQAAGAYKRRRRTHGVRRDPPGISLYTARDVNREYRQSAFIDDPYEPGRGFPQFALEPRTQNTIDDPIGKAQHDHELIPVTFLFQRKHLYIHVQINIALHCR